MIKATSIDAYLAAVRPEQRAALERLRRAIQAAAPKAEEYITYQLPAFRLDGRALLAFGAAETHCALYPMSGAIVTRFRKDLSGFSTSKGTIRFQPDQPLPRALIRRIVKERIAENKRRAAHRRQWSGVD